MSETQTPETDALLLTINEGRIHADNGPLEDIARSLEIDRNRWRSVAEQAEKALRAILPHASCDAPDPIVDAQQALSAFDSLRKEQGL